MSRAAERPRAPLSVAHGAGNDLELLWRAPPPGDIYEADLRHRRGLLEVRHARRLGPFPLLWDGGLRFAWAGRPLPLAALLAALPPGRLLMVDLKGRRAVAARRLLAELTGWKGPRPVIVCTRSRRQFALLAAAPGLRPLWSVGRRRALARLLAAGGPSGDSGTSVRRELLTPAVVAALAANGGWVLAWHVRTGAHARELIGWGVTGLIGDDPEVWAVELAADRDKP